MLIALYLLALIIILLWIASSPFYWKSKKIPHSTAAPIFGSMLPVFKYGLNGCINHLYKQFPGQKYFGIHFLTRPTLIIKDPELIRKILIKDFDYFTSHGMYSNQDRDCVGGNLFHIYGQQWKEMRQKLSPFFTPTKIKSMLTCVKNTAPKLFNSIDKLTENGRKPIEVEKLFLQATSDVMVQTIFGIKSDLYENDNSVFVDINEKLMRRHFLFRLTISIISPKLYDLMKFIIFEKNFNKILSDIFNDTIELRKHGKQVGNDIVEGLIQLLNIKPSSEEKYFPDSSRVPKYKMETISSQALIFYVGGVETTSLTLSFLFYELALHPELQTKCREEINSIVPEGAEINIESVNKLKYLSAAIKEILRMHTVFPMINRECTKAYKVPDSDLIIDKGTFLIMSPYAIHMDEKYYSEPKKFRPERFLNENKDDCKIPGTIYFPFGEGPRTCIGIKFAKVQLKLLAAKLLKRYEFTPSSKTIIPMEYAKSFFFNTPANGIWLNIRRI